MEGNGSSREVRCLVENMETKDSGCIERLVFMLLAVTKVMGNVGSVLSSSDGRRNGPARDCSRGGQTKTETCHLDRLVLSPSYLGTGRWHGR
jgi:hypothetical protein